MKLASPLSRLNLLVASCLLFGCQAESGLGEDLRPLLETAPTKVFKVSSEESDPRINKWSSGEDLDPPIEGWPGLRFSEVPYELSARTEAKIIEAMKSTAEARPTEDLGVNCAFVPDFRFRYELASGTVDVLVGGYGSKTCADKVFAYKSGKLRWEMQTFGDQTSQQAWTDVYRALDIAKIPN